MRRGSSFERKALNPGFCSPIAFNIPAGVSTILGPGFPCRGLRVSPFTMIAPSFSRSIRDEYSSPNPKVPEAASMGFFNFSAPSSTSKFAITTPPHPN